MTSNDFSKITEENVFKYVIGKKDNCLELLRRALQGLNLQTVEVVPGRVGAKNVDFNWNQLNVLAHDGDDNTYNIKLNVFNNKNKLKRYMDGMNSLAWQPTRSDVQIKKTYIICFCNFDPFNRGNILYEFDAMDTKVKGDSVHIQVYNSKGR